MINQHGVYTNTLITSNLEKLYLKTHTISTSVQIARKVARVHPANSDLEPLGVEEDEMERALTVARPQLGLDSRALADEKG
jgi:hypothetical protein